MAERAGIYCRISEDPRQTESGVTRQQEDCESLVESRGWELVGTWIDNDVAVLRPGAQRDQYDALMTAVEQGQITRVVAYGLSRLWRNRTERAEAIERLKARRVGVALVKGQDLDMSSAAGRMYAGMLGEFDTAESEIKAERVARAALQRAESGKANGHPAFGWTRVRTRNMTGDVVDWQDHVDPEAAAVVSEIVQRLRRRETLSAIARDLTTRGVPTPRAWLKRANGAPETPAGVWGTGTVRKIAMRPANVGRVVRSTEVRGVDGTPKRTREEFGDAAAPALISRADHDSVVAFLNEPSRTTCTRRRTDGPGGHARPGARQHLLTYGIGSCGVCGTHLRVARKGTSTLYVCDSPRGCVGRRQQWVDDLVDRVVVGRLERDDARDLFQRDDGAAAVARERAAGLRARLASAADAFAEGDIDREQLKRITARLRPELEAAEQDSIRAVAGVAPDLVADLVGDRAQRRWDELDSTQRRAVLEALGMSVVILPSGGGPNFKPQSVRIKWDAEDREPS